MSHKNGSKTGTGLNSFPQLRLDPGKPSISLIMSQSRCCETFELQCIADLESSQRMGDFEGVRTGALIVLHVFVMKSGGWIVIGLSHELESQLNVHLEKGPQWGGEWTCWRQRADNMKGLTRRWRSVEQVRTTRVSHSFKLKSELTSDSGSPVTRGN